MEKSDLYLKYKDVYLQKNIIIVGAGISGLACANRLRQLGFQNVKVLEARDRIGGRIHEVMIGSSIVELGAQWIHGHQNNVVYQLGDALGLIKENSCSFMHILKCYLTFSQIEIESIEKLLDFLFKMNYPPKELFRGTSVSNYFDELFTPYMNQRDFPQFDFLHEGSLWYRKFLKDLNEYQDLSLLFVNLYNNYKECEDEAHVELKGGFSTFLDILVSLVSSDWILKNKSVIKIDWSDFKEVTEKCSLSNNSRKIKVYCEDGETFIADHVVITIPLGCLKANSQSMFNPGLSACKELAIHSLGFGTVNKVYFQFEKPFWKEYDVYLVFVHHLKGYELLTKDIKKFVASIPERDVPELCKPEGVYWSGKARNLKKVKKVPKK